MSSGYGLNRHLKSHNIIRRCQCIRILQINLMLGRRDLVMRSLNLKSHLFQIQHNIPPYIFRHINRAHIKISGHFMRFGSWLSFFICLKQKKFTFWTYQKSITHIGCFFQYLFQHKARISLKRFSSWPIHITNQPCHLPLLRPPRKNFKSIQIRMQVHIRLLNPHKSLNRRTIKHTTIIQCLSQLAGSYGHILQHSKNICKLQTDKLHIIFFHHTDDVFFAILIHRVLLLSLNCIHTKTRMTKDP